MIVLLILIFFFKIWSPKKLSPKLPVTYISSFIETLFLLTIFEEKPNETIVKDEYLDFVVSPPDSLISYFFCSSLIDFDIKLRFFLSDIEIRMLH